MVERFFESTAPVKRDREQSATWSNVPERKKGRRDLEQANTSASSQTSVAIKPESVVEGCGERPTITPTASISKTPVASVDSLLESDLELTDAVRLGRTAKASKADDGRVPEYLWDDRIMMSPKARDVDRDDRVPEYLWDDRIMMSPKARDVDRDDLLAALQFIRRGVLRFWNRSVAVSFYEWWKREQKAARHAARSPSMRSLAVASKALAHAADQDPSVASKQRAKLDKFRLRESVAPPTEPILSLMSTFSVAKGDDIRMVFDASKSVRVKYRVGRL
jgi:hypothetical protein